MIFDRLDEFVAPVDVRFGVKTFTDVKHALDGGYCFVQRAFSEWHPFAVTVVPVEVNDQLSVVGHGVLSLAVGRSLGLEHFPGFLPQRFPRLLSL